MAILLMIGATPAVAIETSDEPGADSGPIEPERTTETGDPLPPLYPQAPVEPVVPTEDLEQVSPVRTPGPTRIMLVGDSVTQGYPGDFTYRYRLWQALTNQGVDFDFVGHRTDLGSPSGMPRFPHSYPVSNFDRDHSGEGGSRFHSLRFPLAETVHDLEPDIIIVMMGINDLREGRSALSIAGVAERFVRQVREVAPSVDIVLAHLSQTYYRVVPDYNARLDAIANRLSTSSSRIVTAKTAVGYTDADMWDQLHPNAAGEVKIARAVHGSLVHLGVAPATRVNWPSPAPGPVIPISGLQAVAGRGAVQLSWQPAPGATGYLISHRNMTRNGAWITAGPTTGLASTVASLAPNETYTFAVRPVKGKNPAESRVSAIVTVQAGDGSVTRPSAPARPTAVVGGSTITLTWPQLVDHGGASLTQYLVRQSYSGGARWITVPGSQTRLVLRNQPRGVSTFHLYATNRVGNSTASQAQSVAIATVPSAPALPALAVTGRTVKVVWQPPNDNGGSPVTGYVIQYGNRYVSTSSSNLTLTLRNLPRGTLDIRVYATNAVGNSVASPTRRITVR